MGYSLRTRILSGAIGLLILFAISLATTLILVKDSGDEIAGIAEYHQPLVDRIAAVDVYTFELELVAREVIAEKGLSVEKRRELGAKARDLTNHIRALVKEAIELVVKGSNDERNDIHDRLVLARLTGRLRTLEPDLEHYLSLLSNGVDLALQNKMAEAQQELVKLDTQSMVDDHVKQSRLLSNELISTSLKETESNIFNIIWTNVALFGVAALLGSAVFVLITGRVHRAIHLLLDAVARTAKGHDLSPLPVTSSDEIGELSSSFNRMVEQLKAKKKLQESFGQFIDPRVLTMLVDADTGELRHSAERRAVTVFFCDVAKFSSLGEQLTADALVRVLNHYFTAATSAITKHNGIVDKFIGDAVMAFWASPFSEGEFHARDACFACLEMTRAFERIRGEISNITGLRRSAPDFRVRLALASGDTLIGTVGSTTKKNFTVMGDTVNVASRLEAINKVFGTSIIINEECYRLAESDIEVRELDIIRVYGKEEPSRIYELLGKHGEVDPDTLRLRDAFERAIERYRDRKWSEAEELFRACLEIKHDDGPSRTYLDRLATFATTPPDEKWDGVWQVSGK